MAADMKILVLHSKLSGYWMACMQAFIETYQGSFSVIRKEVSANAPYKFTETQNISLHTFNSFSKRELVEFCKKEKPDLIYVSGWSVAAYLAVAKYFYAKNIPVLCGLDNHWKGTFRQRLGYIYLRQVLSRRFTHLWIPGLYQFETARKIGFSKERILTGVYSADVPLFSKAVKKNKDDFKRSFLFLGRLIPRKGLKELMQAYDKLRERENSNWSLTIVGNGPLRSEVKQFSGVNYIDFLQPEQLPELFHRHSVFVAPSRREPWGVVIHEAAAAGLPIITTRQCGAATAFVRNGYNGYLTKAGDVESLYQALERITQKSDSELFVMGKKSEELSLQYTPQTWASTLYQLIES